MTTNDATPREADRAVPEPDADAVYELAWKIATAWGHAESFDNGSSVFDTEVGRGIRDRAYKAAGVALSAASPEPSLDDLLDSVWTDSDPVELTDFMLDGDNWSVWIRSCYTQRHVDADHPLYHVAHGTGETRMEAIQNAVANAQKGDTDV